MYQVYTKQGKKKKLGPSVQIERTDWIHTYLIDTYYSTKEANKLGSMAKKHWTEYGGSTKKRLRKARRFWLMPEANKKLYSL